MPYTDLINKIISRKKLSTSDILNKFEAIGVNYSRSYINKVLNGNCKIPSEDFSKAIAKICDVDERLLLIESSFDKCDKVMQECLYELFYKGLLFSQNVLSNSLSNNNIFKNLRKLSISELIIYILDNKTNINELNYKFTITNNGKIQFNFSEIFEYTMIDNSMSPIIKKDDKFKVEIKEKYEDMDIVYVYINEKKQNIVRRVIFKEDKIFLYPENKIFPMETYNKENVKILAKITRIMREI